MTRSVSVCAAIALVVAAAGARADTGMLPNGAMLNWEKVYITEDGTVQEPSTPDAMREYLNLAHCVCSASGAGTETTISYDLRLSIDTNTSRPAEVWVGAQCDDDQQRPMTCRMIDTIPDIDQLAIRTERIELSLYDVINGADITSPCRQDEGDAYAWVLVDSDADSTYDYFATQAIGNITTTPMDQLVRFDTKAPPIPTAFEGSSAEGAISLSWTAPESRATDVYYYQALCARADGTPGLTSPPDARYQTVRGLCGLEQDLVLDPVELSGADSTPAVLTDSLAQLDPSYLCGGTDDPTATGMLIDGLENGEPYTVVLLAIDYNGNAAGVYFTTTITPQPATDFWEDLHDRGSNVEGGFCLGTTTGGGGGPISAAVVGLAALLAIGRRRRRLARPRLATLATTVAIVLVPVIASAQVEPYWTEEGSDVSADPEEVTWHAGLRLGPYTPNIDGQFGMSPGPYEDMFGGYQILPMIDLDRVVWRRFGQLGIGGSIGYMQKSANAWADGSVPGDPMRPRSPGDENRFRLMPLALTGVYRFTWLDDNYGIPVVPYLRAGLSYYLWWFTTNGNTSTACFDGSRDTGCDADKAIGASLGLQGSIGLAIRAERIDANSARSMRASGIQHAGFYAELQAAWVDGFGRSNADGTPMKLSVGDTTWFAGVDFEF